MKPIDETLWFLWQYGAGVSGTFPRPWSQNVTWVFLLVFIRQFWPVWLLNVIFFFSFSNSQCSVCTTSPSSSTWVALCRTPWWTSDWRMPVTRPCTRWDKHAYFNPLLTVKLLLSNTVTEREHPRVTGLLLYAFVSFSWVWKWRSWRTWRKMQVWAMVAWVALQVSIFSCFVLNKFKKNFFFFIPVGWPK